MLEIIEEKSNSLLVEIDKETYQSLLSEVDENPSNYEFVFDSPILASELLGK